MATYVPLGVCSFYRDWNSCRDKDNALLFIPMASTFYRSCKSFLAVDHEVGTVAAVDFTHILLIASAGNIFMEPVPPGMRNVGVPLFRYNDDFVTESIDAMGQD